MALNPQQFRPVDHVSIMKDLAKNDDRLRGARAYNGMVRNIHNTFNAASPEHVQAGMRWYQDAHDYAGKLSDKYGVSHEAASGVLAALSPLKSWSDNKKLGAEFLATGRAGHTEHQNAVATAIVNGAHPLSVLPERKKTGHFYSNIAHPDRGGRVTIDRHAHDLAVGQVYGDSDRGLDQVGRYGLFHSAYMDATHKINEGRGSNLILPHQVQAVTWTHHRGGAD